MGSNLLRRFPGRGLSSSRCGSSFWMELSRWPNSLSRRRQVYVDSRASPQGVKYPRWRQGANLLGLAQPESLEPVLSTPSNSPEYVSLFLHDTVYPRPFLDLLADAGWAIPCTLYLIFKKKEINEINAILDVSCRIRFGVRRHCFKFRVSRPNASCEVQDISADR